VVAAAVAHLQLVILRVQAETVGQVVEQQETMRKMQAQLLDRELRVKVLTVDRLGYWVRGRAVVAVVQRVLVQRQLTTCPLRVKAEAEHSIRLLALQFAMQPVAVQEHALLIRLVLRVIAAVPLHRMVVLVRLVQSPPLHQLQILALVAEALVGQMILI
jgi:hypothetical protein